MHEGLDKGSLHCPKGGDTLGLDRTFAQATVNEP